MGAHSHNKLGLSIPLHCKNIQQYHYSQRQGNPSSWIRLRIPKTNHRSHRTQLRAKQHDCCIKIRPSQGKSKRRIHISLRKFKNTASDWEISRHFPNSQVARPNEDKTVDNVCEQDGKWPRSTQGRANPDEETCANGTG